MSDWEIAQEWERGWWGICANTYGEEEKQLLYAEKMGLRRFHDGRSPYNFDLGGQRILDMGGGPVSLLLKCVNVEGVVVDPILARVPNWVKLRYQEAGVGFVDAPAEHQLSWEILFDEVWMYNVLQHVEDPARVVANAKKVGKLIRIFEWINTTTNIGHPHTLTEEVLNNWLGGEGKVEQLTGQAGCFGRCYYGIFPT